ncbi:hypothetical protein BV25DRAFT_1815655 [Artomyces pyxidatus]|uniref:Uncharacterized protein n=1 Tax=Artomyces pyxidatus TaxID=48021 RepID=A0ACB8SHN6_9AGAM|nr:hypothetical protein BV25DRAFT_1815655 [Artomyces pyxidatus]
MPPSSTSQTCCCGRSFSQPSALTFHQKSCKKSKTRLSSALSSAKEAWIAKKKARISLESAVSSARLQVQPSAMDTDSHLSLLERRSWTARPKRMPERLKDYLPEPATALPPPQIARSETTTKSTDTSHPAVLQALTTRRNTFGLFRRYHANGFPTHDPEDLVSLISLTKATFRDLLAIVGDSGYRPEDVSGTNWDKIDSILGTETCSTDDRAEEWQDEDAGWSRSTVKISVPYHPRRGATNRPGAGPRSFLVHDFYHRDLVSVIREKISRPQDDPFFHYEPYELYWQPHPAAKAVRVHGELYTSPAFLAANLELQRSAPEPGCTLSRHIIALMFWSDATHLTSFGDAKLWPLYLYFGNDSKYRRCQPSAHLCEHVAYFQSLPDEFQEFAAQQTAGGKTPNGAFRTHCARELVHAQLKVLLSDDFLKAWAHGLVIKCCDGVHRRFYPRIFTYSADYPEKILLASIRNLGSCPCPRCLVSLSQVYRMGTQADMIERRTKARVDDSQRRRKVEEARKLIYQRNLQVSSDAVEAWLSEESLVPNQNAFSEKLAPLGLNMFTMFAVDLMHEWELGVGRSIFVHLLRILGTLDEGLLVELDRRFRLVPSFGTAIRRFSRNSSEMKQMAARDLENIWQCAIPVFEGLLPEPHNGTVLRLLYVGANWHGMAKLRMHTDPSLALFDTVTTSLGQEIRFFSEETCSAFQTLELTREKDARIRRAARKAAKSKSVVSESNADAAPPLQCDPPLKAYREPKTFNMKTYKIHSLGDYADTIRWIGTTDSYSTEPAELEHHTSKIRYARTSRRGFVKQMAQIERRERRIRRIRVRATSATGGAVEDTPSVPQEHYNVGLSENFPVNITLFQQENSNDPAVKHFVRKLKDHIAPRIRAMLLREASLAEDHDSSGPSNVLRRTSEQDADATLTEHATDYVFFKNDRMYEHRIMKINYTTYDVRRGQDIIHTGTNNRDIMVLAPIAESEEPSASLAHRFWFGRVLRIFHVNVVYTGPGMVDYSSRRIYFLWVRWFLDLGEPAKGDDSECRLDALRLAPIGSDDAFGFVDPDSVLRCSHIIPAFARGKLREDGSKLSSCANDANDWYGYYVNRFADRDMLMRFHWGLAVGHTYSYTRHHEAQQASRSTRDSQPELDADGSAGTAQLTERMIPEGCIMQDNESLSNNAENDSATGEGTSGKRPGGTFGQPETH